MTVCDLTHAYHETSGGIRTYMNAKRRYVLDHTEHRYVAIVPGAEDAVERDGRAVTVQIAGPVMPKAAPYRWFRDPRKVYRALQEHAPDLVEVQTLYMPTEWGPAFAYRARHRRQSAVAMMVHTDFAGSYATDYGGAMFGAWAGPAIGKAAGLYVGSVLLASDLCLTPSPFQAERLSGHRSTVHVITPGVDTDTFRPGAADPALRAELGVAPDATLAVYVGRLDSEKRTETMVEAVTLANETSPTTLMMVGEGPHRDMLEARERQGAPLRVLPFLSGRAELARLLASSDVYLTAGPYETFGISVIEAQACGLPVVGVRAGALIERVPPEIGVLGPVDDASAMAENLARAAAAREAMGPAARRHAVEEFSWKVPRSTPCSGSTTPRWRRAGGSPRALRQRGARAPPAPTRPRPAARPPSPFHARPQRRGRRWR